MRTTNTEVGNVGWVCSDCAKKAPCRLAVEHANDPTFFVGKFVKTQFVTKRPDSGKELIEHMWVKIVGVTSCGQLAGVLANDPVGESEMHVGFEVVVRIDEIEDAGG